MKTGNKRKVDQLDMDGNLIKTWNSMKDAKSIASNISHVCRGRESTSGGFKWRYTPINDINEESWRQHPEYKIQCSDKGRVKLMSGKKTHGVHAKSNYKFTTVKTKDNYKKAAVHRLIMETFDPWGEIVTMYADKNFKAQVDHIDGNESNNNLDNLQWLTPSEHALKTNRK